LERELLSTISELTEELAYLGLLEKAKEIYSQLGDKALLSYIKSSYRLLSKVYHPDLNPKNAVEAEQNQIRLNKLRDLIDQMGDDEIIELFRTESSEPVSGKTRILVVEDEFGLQELLMNVLLMEGFDVRVAIDGESGYAAYHQFNPDIVITDIVMPKMNGLELVEKIRKINPGVKVIYASGFFGIQNLRQKIHQEVQKYGYRTFSKPCKMSELLQLISEYLEESSNSGFVRGI